MFLFLFQLISRYIALARVWSDFPDTFRNLLVFYSEDSRQMSVIFRVVGIQLSSSRRSLVFIETKEYNSILIISDFHDSHEESEYTVSFR